MRYLPILQELFEADTVIFLIMGLAIAAVIGLWLKKPKKLGTGAGISALVYVICEAMSNIRSNFMIELILLFFGTVAIGSFLGFIVSFVILLLRNRRIDG